MSNLCCPVCFCPLILQDSCYRCNNGHSFDRAASGYVNLLLHSGKGKRHGDDKRMVKARTAFLSKNYYLPFAKAVAEIVDRNTASKPIIVDAGCGEGYYDTQILQQLQQSGKAPSLLGIDISKDVAAHAAKHVAGGTFAVASCARLPVASESTDVVLNLFSPRMPAEFSRVLRSGGIWVFAYPLPRHLWELKQLIYDTPYENPATMTQVEGWQLAEHREVRDQIHLPDNQSVMELFQMTPYYYKTGIADQKKAEHCPRLKVTLEFGIDVFQKP